MVGWTISGTSGLINGINLSPIASLVERQIAPLNSDIKKQVYEFYAVRTPDTEKLATWIKFLKGLRDIDPALEIFTTNYDLVLEDATEQANKRGIRLVHSRLSVTLDQDYSGTRTV